MHEHLIEPHGGSLTNLLASEERAGEMKVMSREWPSWDLTPRQSCDLELLMNGGFSPLRGFMTKSEYESVCKNMQLPSGNLWPMPVMLDVTEEVAAGLKSGDVLALRDLEGTMLAGLHVEEVWKPDHKAEAKHVFGSTNEEHPGVRYLLQNTNPYYVAGW